MDYTMDYTMVTPAEMRRMLPWWILPPRHFATARGAGVMPADSHGSDLDKRARQVDR